MKFFDVFLKLEKAGFNHIGGAIGDFATIEKIIRESDMPDRFKHQFQEIITEVRKYYIEELEVDFDVEIMELE